MLLSGFTDLKMTKQKEGLKNGNLNHRDSHIILKLHTYQKELEFKFKMERSYSMSTQRKIIHLIRKNY